MKKLTIAALVTIIVGSAAYTAIAQQQRGHHGPMLEGVDANQDGNISKDEVMAHRAEKFTSADTNGDNLVTADEFEAFALAERERKQEERRARRFAKLDADGDGFITAEEHAAADKRTDRMFERIDKDGDGLISEAEREAAMEKMKNRRGKRGMGRRG
ncbi:MAG: EF-hand domain-containing protein [Pseudomonadota bacterium]